MNYSILIGVIIGAWILINIITLIFATFISNNTGVYTMSIVDRGKNILYYGFFGLIAIIVRNNFQNKITYYLMIVLVIIFGILFLVDSIKLLFTVITTLMLIFDKSYYGLEDEGMFGDWIFISSMIVESGLMGFITLNMFNTVF